MSSDILSILFLALVAIVVAGLVHRLAPNNVLIVPSFAFIAVALWIAYDFILIKKHKGHKEVDKEKIINQATDKEIDLMVNELIDETHRDIAPAEIKKENHNSKLEKSHLDDYDVDLYNKDVDFRDMYNYMGCSGDNRLANRMKYMGVQAQLSKDNRASYNKYSLQPYVEEELRENEDREWWNNDALESQM